MAGVSLTRTYTAEFRHPTDNSTWTSWAAWNLANAQTISYDPTERTIFQHRFTRTGSDATGGVELYAIILNIPATRYDQRAQGVQRHRHDA